MEPPIGIPKLSKLGSHSKTAQQRIQDWNELAKNPLPNFQTILGPEIVDKIDPECLPSIAAFDGEVQEYIELITAEHQLQNGGAIEYTLPEKVLKKQDILQVSIANDRAKIEYVSQQLIDKVCETFNIQDESKKLAEKDIKELISLFSETHSIVRLIACWKFVLELVRHLSEIDVHQGCSVSIERIHQSITDVQAEKKKLHVRIKNAVDAFLQEDPANIEKMEKLNKQILDAINYVCQRFHTSSTPSFHQNLLLLDASFDMARPRITYHYNSLSSRRTEILSQVKLYSQSIKLIIPLMETQRDQNRKWKEVGERVEVLRPGYVPVDISPDFGHLIRHQFNSRQKRKYLREGKYTGDKIDERKTRKIEFVDGEKFRLVPLDASERPFASSKIKPKRENAGDTEDSSDGHWNRVLPRRSESC